MSEQGAPVQSSSGAARSQNAHPDAPVLEVRGVSKYFGNVIALNQVSATVDAGEVTCVLGDNGAGKSTMIKILSGFHQPDQGSLLMDGHEQRFASPIDARNAGIATVYQDLAIVPLMSVWRNFFLGAEPRKGVWPFRYFDTERARRIAMEEIANMGIPLRDPDQPIGTLSGGERQSVATARAVYFGARVLILDEPTAALGVRQAGVVLKYVTRARDRGLAVVFITHNPSHAYLVGDRFVILNRGARAGSFRRDEISRNDLVQQMSGGAELDEIEHGMERAQPTSSTASGEDEQARLH